MKESILKESRVFYSKNFPKELSIAFDVAPFSVTSEGTKLLCRQTPTMAEAEQMTKGGGLLEFFTDPRYNLEKTREEYYDICHDVPDIAAMRDEAIKKGLPEAMLYFALESAIILRASDIHLMAELDRLVVKLRIDGILRTLTTLPIDSGEQFIRYIKVRSKIDISKTLHPLEGRFSSTIQGENLDIRVSIMPTARGEKLSLRILGARENLFTLEDIGFDPEEMMLLQSKINLTAGFILVAGNTRSGKSTTLLALLHGINNGRRNIVTIEDPVEYHMDGMVQVSLPRDRSSDYYDILKFTLRQDPDVIMIGEIRDADTADTSMKAAATGHLVLSTIHTKSAVSAVERLLDLGVENYLLSEAISLVISQRLLRVLCPHCKSREKIQGEMAERLELPKDTIIYKEVGCVHCYGTGYSGRRAVFEILHTGDSARQKIREGKLEELRKETQTMSEKIKDMVVKGVTSPHEAIRYTY